MRGIYSGRGKRLWNFIRSKSFYIALVLCVSVIGIAGYSAVRESLDMLKQTYGTQTQTDSAGYEDLGDEEWDLGVLGEGEDYVPGGEVLDGSEQQDDGDNTGSAGETGATTDGDASGGASGDVSDTVPDESEETVETAGSVSGGLIVMPLTGRIIKGFSLEKLVYSKTMEDWRIHAGIDIEGSLGAAVRAMSDGTVEDVYFDDAMGKTVVIDHGGGLKSLYANLAEGVTVKKGDKVKANAVIGGVGETASYECADVYHLHFELIRDGARIDPLSYIKNY